MIENKEKIMMATFLGLNMADAILTNKIVGAGGTEIMPLAKIFGSNLLLWKWLIPLGIVGGLYYKEKMNLLKPLNVAMGTIVLWNTAALTAI